MDRLEYDREEECKNDEQIRGHQQRVKDHGDYFGCLCQGRYDLRCTMYDLGTMYDVRFTIYDLRFTVLSANVQPVCSSVHDTLQQYGGRCYILFG